MGLGKANIRIPLGASLQTNLDDKLLPLGHVLELENAYSTRDGEIVKRFGTNAYANTVLGGGSIPQSHAVAAYKGALVSLSVPGPTPLLTRSPTLNEYVAATSKRRGPLSYSKFGIGSAMMSGDIAYSSGVYFVAALDTTGSQVQLVQMAIDAGTGARIFTRRVTTSGLGFGWRVGIANGYAVFVYVNGGNVVCDSFLISTLPSSPSTTASTAGSATNRQLDVRTNGTALSVCYVTGGNAEGFDLAPSTGTITTWALKDSTAANIASPAAMSWVLDLGGSGKIALCTGTNVQWNIPASGGTRQATTTYVSGGAGTLRAVAGCTTTSNATGTGIVMFDDGATTTVSSFVFDSGSVTGGPAIIARSVLLQSKIWTYAGDFYCAVKHPTTSQYTSYVINLATAAATVGGGYSSTLPQAIIEPQQGTQNGTTFNILSSAPMVSSTTAAYCLDIARTFAGAKANGAPIFGDDIGVDVAVVTHGAIPNTTIGPPREAIDSLLVPGGALGLFDGQTYHNATFAYFPDSAGITITATAGGGMTTSATYFYRAVYRFMDAAGRIWRSAPSVAKSVAMGANGSTSSTIPTLRLVDPTITVSVEWYRGGANDSANFQLVGFAANDRTADTVTILDTFSDTQIAGDEFLYTNGGVLQNDTSPGFKCSCVAGNRHFGVPMDDQQSIWPSNLFVIGQGLVQSIDNVVDVKDQHGSISALANIDDKVAVFKADAVYQVTGDGPDALGRGGFDVSPVAIGIGAANPQSVVETKDGTIFKSTSQRAGFFLLDRGMSISYIGAPVQKYLADTTVAAVLIPSLSQARFYHATGRVLVYDFAAQDIAAGRFGVWSTFVLQSSGVATAAVVSGVPVYGDTSATVWAEDLSGVTYTDGGNAYTMRVTTPWFNGAGLRGYERLYALSGLGQTITSHTLTITLYADYDDVNAVKTVTVIPGALWDWQMRYSKKFSAFKLVLTEMSGTAGAKMTALEAVYGVRGPNRPQPASKRAA